MRFAVLLPALLCTGLSAFAQVFDPMDSLYRYTTRPTRPDFAARATLPELPAPSQLAVAPVGTLAATGFQNSFDPLTAQYLEQRLLRLQQQYRDIYEEYEDAVQSGDTELSYYLAVQVFYKLQEVQAAQQGGMTSFFPNFGNPSGAFPVSHSGAEIREEVEDTGIEAAETAVDQDNLSGLPRLTFVRHYGRSPFGGGISHMTPGHVSIATGVPGKSETKAVIQIGMFGPERWNMKTSIEEENNMADFYYDRQRLMGQASDGRALAFYTLKGDPKRQERTFITHLQEETQQGNPITTVYDAGGNRFARIRQEIFTNPEENHHGSQGDEILQRVFYFPGNATPVGSLVSGEYAAFPGDTPSPALILRKGSGPEAEPMFMFVFENWLARGEESRADEKYLRGISKFIDAWIVSENLRAGVRISGTIRF